MWYSEFNKRKHAQRVTPSGLQTAAKIAMAVGGTAAVGAVSGGVGLLAVGAVTALEVGAGCVMAAAGSGALAGAATGSVGAALTTFASYLGWGSTEKKKEETPDKKIE